MATTRRTTTRKHITKTRKTAPTTKKASTSKASKKKRTLPKTMSEATRRNSGAKDISANQQKFLAAFEECGVICRAAKNAGLTHQSHWRWMQEDSGYPERFEQAKRVAADKLEGEARRRAVDGVYRLKYFNGEPVMDPRTGKHYIEHDYSDTLLIFLLKGALPEKYADRRQVSGPEGGPVSLAAIDLSVSPEEAAKQYRELIKAVRG